jgi:hypothetical protein
LDTCKSFLPWDGGFSFGVSAFFGRDLVFDHDAGEACFLIVCVSVCVCVCMRQWEYVRKASSRGMVNFFFWCVRIFLGGDLVFDHDAGEACVCVCVCICVYLCVYVLVGGAVELRVCEGMYR